MIGGRHDLLPGHRYAQGAARRRIVCENDIKVPIEHAPFLVAPLRPLAGGEEVPRPLHRRALGSTAHEFFPRGAVRAPESLRLLYVNIEEIVTTHRCCGMQKAYGAYHS